MSIKGSPRTPGRVRVAGVSPVPYSQRCPMYPIPSCSGIDLCGNLPFGVGRKVCARGTSLIWLLQVWALSVYLLSPRLLCVRLAAREHAPRRIANPTHASLPVPLVERVSTRERLSEDQGYATETFVRISRVSLNIKSNTHPVTTTVKSKMFQPFRRYEPGCMMKPIARILSKDSRQNIANR